MSNFAEDFAEALKKMTEERKDDFNPNMKNVFMTSTAQPEIIWTPYEGEIQCMCHKKATKKATNISGVIVRYGCIDCFLKN